MRTIEQMVQQEVMCCMSSIVSTLAAGQMNVKARCELNALVEQAFELACPILDYEEAAIQEGWTTEARRTPEEYCNKNGIEPYDREVFEHWAVSQWFADKLCEAGEKVDDDFGGLCVWARTTTGQGIASDGVVERIYAAMMVPA